MWGRPMSVSFVFLYWRKTYTAVGYGEADGAYFIVVEYWISKLWPFISAPVVFPIDFAAYDCNFDSYWLLELKL